MNVKFLPTSKLINISDKIKEVNKSFCKLDILYKDNSVVSLVAADDRQLESIINDIEYLRLAEANPAERYLWQRLDNLIYFKLV